MGSIAKRITIAASIAGFDLSSVADGNGANGQR